MQSGNFFIHLRFIFTGFEHKFLKIGDTHETQYTFRMFSYEESVKFYFARDIGEKWGNKQNQSVKIDSLFT